MSEPTGFALKMAREALDQIVRLNDGSTRETCKFLRIHLYYSDLFRLRWILHQLSFVFLQENMHRTLCTCMYAASYNVCKRLTKIISVLSRA